MKTVCLLCGAGRIVTVCGDNSCRCTLRTRGRIEGLQSRLGLVFKKGDRWTTVAPCGASVLLSEQRRWFRELTAAGLAPERGIPAGFTVRASCDPEPRPAPDVDVLDVRREGACA